MEQEKLIYIFIGFILLLLLLLVIALRHNYAMQKMMKNFIKTNQEAMDVQQKIDQLQNTVSQQLFHFENTLSDSMKDDLYRFNETTVNRMANLEKQVSVSLNQGFERNGEAFIKLMEQVGRLDAAQSNLTQLNKNIGELQKALTDKKTRGIYGEVQLYTLLENIFGTSDFFYQKQVRLSNGFIADCLISGPKSLGKIVVDAKFPLENFNRMNDASYSAQEINRYKSEFRKDVVRQIKSIAEKYLIPQETADFACMFIPSEAVYSMIVSEFNDLLQIGYSFHVYLVSPTTLMAYLTAIQSLYLEQKRSENAQEIQVEMQKLSKEFERFKERWGAIQKDFEKLLKDIQLFSITADKISSGFEKIENVRISQTEEK